MKEYMTWPTNKMQATFILLTCIICHHIASVDIVSSVGFSCLHLFLTNQYEMLRIVPQHFISFSFQ